MILFFTGTGNSLQVAETIAHRCHDRLFDIGAAYKRNECTVGVRQGEDLGFVFPTYAWSTPKIIDEFLDKLTFNLNHGRQFKPAYCYLVLTCAAFVGNTARFFADELEKKQHIKLNGSFSVQSVGTCVYLYNPAQGEKQKFQLEEARRQTQEAAHLIAANRWEHKEERNPFGLFMSHFTGKDHKSNSIDPFHVLDSCVGCGTCAAICPTNTIAIVDGKPTWSGDDCTQCLSCLHRCPMQATQYGKSTERRDRFVNPILADQTSEIEKVALALKEQRDAARAAQAAAETSEGQTDEAEDAAITENVGEAAAVSAGISGAEGTESEGAGADEGAAAPEDVNMPVSSTATANDAESANDGREDPAQIDADSAPNLRES